MAKYSAVKATVNAYIKQNGRKEITGKVLNAVLNATIDSLGKYFQFAGGALPTDNPGTPDQNVCYLAGEPGVYTNFGGITIENEEVALLFWNGEWTKQRILIGIREVNASVDNQVGTPSVDVSYSGGELVLTFHNLKGEHGDTGDPAGFGTIGADINGGVGTPGVSVETSGDNTAKNLMFHFTNLKGETGVTSVVATIDDTSGTPSCQVSLVGQQLTLAFSGLKGLKGDTGVSADYPITIYNGLDSDATDQALAAAQGKVLDGKVSQLGQKIVDKTTLISELLVGYIRNDGSYDPQSNLRHTNKIAICNGETIIVRTAIYGAPAILCFDKYGNVVDTVAGTSSTLRDIKEYSYTVNIDSFIVVNGAVGTISVNFAKDTLYIVSRLEDAEGFDGTIKNALSEEYLSCQFQQGKTINQSAVIVSATGYLLSEPIHIYPGNTIIIDTRGALMSVLTKCDEQGNPTESLIYQSDASYSSKWGHYEYVVREEMLVRVSGYATLTPINISIALSVLMSQSTDIQVTWNSGYIKENLTFGANSSYKYSSPIRLKAGSRINLRCAGALCAKIVRSDKQGNLLQAIVYEGNLGSANIYTTYHYEAVEDEYIVISGVDTSGQPLTFSVVGIYDRVSKMESELEKCGVYIYPFRTITNKPVIIYKDSLCSGFRPKYNYEVRMSSGSSLRDYTPKSMRFLPTSPGSYILGVNIVDKSENLICEKGVRATVVNMPNAKLTTRSELNVFWCGDSLLGQNGNAIGNEWYRMLNTNDQETHIAADGSVQLPTYNICGGKINTIQFQFLYKIILALEGKRTGPYGTQENWLVSNPFYNIYSTEPDEIGADGFNKRVDFKAYFEWMFGENKYPNILYFCIGPNDLADDGRWEYSYVDITVQRVIAFCKKVKAACDEIAGGSSDFKIKLFNHQTYALFDSVANFPQARQRLLWQKYYDALYNSIINNNIGSYVELIDCASKFDWEVGYAKYPISSNIRYDGEQDKYYPDTVHMNLVGAYNYADCLINDFLADGYYD